MKNTSRKGKKAIRGFEAAYGGKSSSIIGHFYFGLTRFIQTVDSPGPF